MIENPMSDANGNTPQNPNSDVMAKIAALRGAGTKTSAGTKVETSSSRQTAAPSSASVQSPSTAIPSTSSQSGTDSMIAKKIMELRSGIAKHNQEAGIPKKLYVTQEDIEQGRDTSILDKFIEDVIAKRI